MPVDVGGSDDFFGGDGQYLKEKGRYHFIVNAADEQPKKRDGSLLPNAVLQLELIVAGGPQKDKTIDLTFYAPKPDASDKAKAMFHRKLQRIAYACNLLGNKELMGGKLPPVDFTKCKGHQLIADVDFPTDTDGQPKKFLDLFYSNVWHVDDPDGQKDVVKSEQHIGLLPSQFRRSAEYFTELKKFYESKKAGGGSGTNGNGSHGSKPAPTPTVTTPAASVEDLV